MVDKFSQVAGNVPVTNNDPNRRYTVINATSPKGRGLGIKMKSDTVVKIGNPVIHTGDPIEIGAATGKIKDKNYLVLLVKKAA